MLDGTDRPAARVPQVAEIGALLLVVVVVAAVVRAFAGSALLTPWQSAMAVGFTAAVVGVPMLVFALEYGRTGLGAALALGALGGALPPLLLALSGAVGLAARGEFVPELVHNHSGGLSYLRWVFAHGVSIPFHGLLTWHEFLLLTGRSVVVGVASGTIFWLTIFYPGPARWVGWVVGALVLAATIIVAQQLG